MKRALMLFTLTLATGPVLAQSPAVTGILAEHRAAGAGPFSIEAGKAMWTREFNKDGQARSCAACHTADLTRTGKHARTGKTIDPMAPSVVATRLTDRAEVEKWLNRNCKWTLGRACTPQEQGDFLVYIQSQ